MPVDRDHPLFENVVTVRTLAPHTSEVQKSNSILRVLQGFENGSRGEKLIHIELTDEVERPSGGVQLYSLSITENDFHELKKEQCILVDFAAFPEKFVELVRLCLDSDKNQSDRYTALLSDDTQNANSIRASTIVRSTSAKRLEIVETNQFKRVTHLSLKMSVADPTVMVSYLSARLIQETSSGETLRDQIRILEKEQEQSLQRITSLEKQLSHASSDAKAASANMTASYSEQIAQLKEDHMRKIESIRMQNRQELDSVRKDLEQQLSTSSQLTQQLTNEKNDLNQKLKQAEDETSTATQQMRELKSKIEELQKELNSTRQRKSELEQSTIALDRDTVGYKIKVSGMEQQLKDRNEAVENLKQLLNAEAEAKEGLEESLQLYKTSHSKLQQKLESSINEINRGNNIIRKLQEEHRSLRAKAKNRNTAVKAAQAIAEERRQIIHNLETTVSKLKQELSHAHSSVQDAESRRTEALKNLEESRKIIARNQQVIEWLNKELTDTQARRSNTYSDMINSDKITSYQTSRGFPRSKVQEDAEKLLSGMSTLEVSKNYKPHATSRANISSTEIQGELNTTKVNPYLRNRPSAHPLKSYMENEKEMQVPESIVFSEDGKLETSTVENPNQSSIKSPRTVRVIRTT